MKGELRIELVITSIIIIIILSIFIYIAWKTEQTKERHTESMKNFTDNSNTPSTLPICNTTGGACDGYSLATCEFTIPSDSCKLESSSNDVTNWICLIWYEYPGEVNETNDCRGYEKCYCGKYTEKKSIKINNIEWFMGNPGENCIEVCKLYNKKCKEIDFSSVIHEIKNCNLQNNMLKETFSSYCALCNIGGYDNVGIYVVGDHQCYSMVIDGDKLNCTSRDPSAKRLCPCD